MSRLRRALPLLALCVLFVVPASAQKRRAVRSGPPVPSQGNCHTFSFVRAGLRASYHSTAPSGDADFTITYIFDNATQTKTTQVVTTSVGTASVETLIDGEVSGILRGIKHINVKGTQSVPILGTVSTEVDVDFVPSLIAGPAAGWCVGNTWTVSPVTETVIAKTSGIAVPPQVITTAASTGEVLAVGDVVNAAGRNIPTVKYRGVFVSGSSVQPTITWVSMADNIVVKQDTLDAGGAVTSTTILTALQ